MCDLSRFKVLEDDDTTNLRSNYLNEGENNTMQITSKPFTRIKERELQKMQALFMQTEVLVRVLVTKQGFHVLRIIWRDNRNVLGVQEPNQRPMKEKNPNMPKSAVE